MFGTIPTTILSTAPTVDLPIIHDDIYVTLLERPPSQERFEVTVAIEGGVPPVAATLTNHHHPLSDFTCYAGLPCRKVCYAISDSPCDSPTAISVGPSCKRCRSLTSSIPVASLVHEALSPMRADLLPPRKRIRYSDSEIRFEVSSEEDYVLYVPREIGLRVDAEDNYEPYIEPDIDLDVQADIDACILFC
ncbi:hypothetical protein Tco_0312808 [Tanacetum coccineum]